MREGKRTVPTKVLTGVFLVAMGLSCVKKAMVETEPRFDGLTRVDRTLLAHGLYIEDGRDPARPLVLDLYHTMVGFDRWGHRLEPSDPLFQFQKRGQDLTLAHAELLKESWYDALVRKTEAEVIREVLPKDTWAGTCQPAILARLDPRVVAALVEKVGPPTVTWSEIPADEAQLIEMYYPEESCISGTGLARDISDAAFPFHCCGGYLVITDLGEPYSRYIERHRMLMALDEQYRKDYVKIRRPFARRAKRLSRPLDVRETRECDAISTDWRNALGTPVGDRPSILERLSGEDNPVLNQQADGRR